MKSTMRTQIKAELDKSRQNTCNVIDEVNQRMCSETDAIIIVHLLDVGYHCALTIRNLSGARNWKILDLRSKNS